MRLWIITDTHFGHQRMVEFGRPQDFETRIMNSVKRLVTPSDTLIHLGDFCIGKDAYWHEFYQFHNPARRNILVRGNHDRKSYAWYSKNGWDLVVDRLDIALYGHRISLSHEPLYDASFTINVHGHFHNNDHRKMNLPSGYYQVPHKCLAIEETDYQPVLLETFVQS